MSNQDILEKLQFSNEKNILIQGLPSSIEKQFAKVSFSKNVTPLLKIKKIDFALLFAINHNQLCTILKDVFPALHEKSKLWIAYPKSTSKIVSDLNRNCSWDVCIKNSLENHEEVELDTVWSAINFKKCASQQVEICCEEEAEVVEAVPKSRAKTFGKKLSIIPDELDSLFVKHKKAKEFFSSLPSSNQKEFVTWIEGAKRADTKQKRLTSTLEKLLAGKTNPTEK
ncbi:hypothetical protein A9P82_07760 [Arachidicoccus ginsenosidimutans]|uniref:YdeI/OmpD-associated family protein n=1 Tax=Arachidicoccus sp. BS20 TaxID=1850526 RepID=UPI0007F15EA4|nr:YdeI/OmpD-associated family protein [Arachidicoccus sp. BS20]ANI89195.1 hypothetical protein A9P82_07760 [Arachidicoccus sp. BS20]